MDEKKPMSAAERKRKSRAKKKASDPEYQTKENKRIEAIRKNRIQGMNAQQKKAYKLNAAMRKRKSRAKKNEDDVVKNDDSTEISISKSPYRKPQALGKAIKKTVRALPSSPRKRKAVVHGLAKYVGLKLINKLEIQLHGYSLAEETVNQIKNFYLRSDVVYTMPGMNDEITVYDSGRKVKLRKYYLTMYLREAYSLFKMENDNLEVGFSKFCFLRPPNVLLLHETPADQCKCKIHENFILKLKALKINYSNEWWQSILCDTEQNSLCWQGQCNECKDGRKFPEQVLFDREKHVQWYNWKTQLCEERRVLKKVLEEGCVEQLIDLVLEDFGKMRDHTNIKRIQASEFQADQKDKRKRVLQIDFAMSYSAEYQHEVQSALWSRASVTLFTAAVIYDSKCQTYLICSDAPNKDKDTISCFLLHLYEKLEKRKDSIQPEVDVIWSDGPSSEFKNRFMVKLLKVLSAKYSRPFHWKYFATSHGKGIVDGIGGSAKSLVRQRVMSFSDKAIVVQSAQDFANVAAELMPKTQVFYISQAEITEKSISMSLWNEEVPQVTGIKQVHVIECSSEGNIKLLKSARSNNCIDILISECETYSQGDWVLVTYDAEKYPGEVITVKTEEIEVSCMIRSGKYWKWPRNPDIAHYTFDNVIGKLDRPIPATSRGQFYFEKL